MDGAERSSITGTIGVGAAVVALTLTAPFATVAAPAVLAALIIEGSSTSSTGAGVEDFFRGKFTQDGAGPTYVNFLTGPFGIWRALAQASQADPDEPNTVMSSGWGAANASLLVSHLHATDPANPNGGFGTRYPIFAVIGVNPFPTPSNPGAVAISTAYEYDINGNAGIKTLRPDQDGQRNRPARNLFRTSDLFTRDDDTTATDRRTPPRPRPIFAKRAVLKLTKAFTAPQRSSDPTPTDKDTG